MEEHEVLQEAELSGQADSENNLGGSSQKTISYCVKDAAGRMQKEGEIGSTRRDLDCWIRILPQPRTIAMEATIFTGWIYDHLLPHAEKAKVAHPLMLRAIAAAPARSLTACGATSSARVTWPRRRSETGAERCATGTW
jgi:transposase